jgi:hypothetical protein
MPEAMCLIGNELKERSKTTGALEEDTSPLNAASTEAGSKPRQSFVGMPSKAGDSGASLFLAYQTDTWVQIFKI